MKSDICKFVLTLVLLSSATIFPQKTVRDNKQESPIFSSVQLEKLMAEPACLMGYRTNQSGPLSRIDAKEGEKDDSTFTVEKINPDLIGVAGGSEGGRIAVIAASRFPVINFVVSFAGTVVSMEDDRLYVQMGGYRSSGISDSLINAVTPLWKKSFAAWASNDSNEHAKVNKEITEWRKKYNRDILPYMKEEMDSIPEFRSVLSTWYSMSEDYLTELGRFNKKWLAIFGEVDKVVPTQASVRNILHYMDIRGNKSYNIAIIPKCGHAPVDMETKRLIHIDHLIINWLNENVVNNCKTEL